MTEVFSREGRDKYVLVGLTGQRHSLRQRDSDNLNLPPPLTLRPKDRHSTSVIFKLFQKILFTRILSAVSELGLLHDEQFWMSHKNKHSAATGSLL